MALRVVFVSDADAPAEWLRHLEGAAVERRSWPLQAPVAFDELALLVAVCADDRQTAEMLAWLEGAPRMPLLVILPENASPASLERAGAITPDFVAGCSRTAEIVARLKRATAGRAQDV